MATQADLQTTSEVVGDWLSNEMERTERVELTSAELGDRLSLPADEIEAVFERMDEDPSVPVTQAGDSWVVER